MPPESEPTFPVVEIFGPTVQGEGALAGLTTYFVRLGLCDYRCSWCDSMHAVEPRLVKAHAEKLTAAEIRERLEELPTGPAWVTLSGGNPAFHELGPLLVAFAPRWKVAVETQGSLWRDWLQSVDLLTISPKPPSSGMVNDRHDAQTARFMAEVAEVYTRVCIKIVAFDEADVEWAAAFFERYRHVERYRQSGYELYLSAGTSRPLEGETIEETRDLLGRRYRWLCERVAGDARFADVRTLPQTHVLAWGHALGV